MEAESKILFDLYNKHSNAELARQEYNEGKPEDEQLTLRQVHYRLQKYYPEYAKRKTTQSKVGTEESMLPTSRGTISAPSKHRPSLTGKAFVFTSAQNNTPVHKGFFESLRHFCEANQAELIVATFTYNKKGFQNGTKDDDNLWYDPAVVPFIRNESLQVAKDLVFCGELNILPTAVTPLSGLDNYTQDASGIVPHTKVHLKSLPRVKGQDARFMYTTGTVTARNYVEKKAGQKASFHHTYAALYVEIDEQGDWFARQLVADSSGTFHDLNNKYTPKGQEATSGVETIVWGDIHLEKMDPLVFDAAFGEQDTSMLKMLSPKYQFIHDLTDFRARNHHNVNDPYHLARMHFKDQGNVEADIRRCSLFLNHITRYGNPAVVVESNHDLALERWLKEGDVRHDPENAEFFHRMNYNIYKSIREGTRYKPFEEAVRENIMPDRKDKIIFLDEDDSFRVNGIQYALHGHRGPNGSRGNPLGFRNIGDRVNIGHMHSACIIDGVYVAGVSGRLDMDYNKGPSSWSHSHIVTYANGKRAIITMKNGKWRA